MAKLPLLVEPADVEAVMHDPDVLILDLSSQEAYLTQHIPNAVHLEFSKIVRPQPPAMALLPSEAQLSEVLSDHGLTPDKHVIAYDSDNNGRASRLLWTLEVLGHPHYSLLNGGLHAWTNAGHTVEVQRTDPQPTRYQASIRHPEALADKEYVRSHLEDGATVVLDARSPAEFSGADRRAQRGGHIPGAVNLNWIELMDPQAPPRLRPDEQLKPMLEQLGVTPDKEVITHCQTHHRSALTFVALKHLGYPRVRGYAGSWSEWGNDPDLPIEQ